MKLDQRRYFSDKFRSKLYGISACLRAKVLELLLHALSEPGKLLWADQCQKGFVVRSIINEIPFYKMKKAQDLPQAWALAVFNHLHNIWAKKFSIKEQCK